MSYAGGRATHQGRKPVGRTMSIVEAENRRIASYVTILLTLL